MQDKFMLCRDSIYNGDTREFLLARISGSDQEKDLSRPPNCNGFGRIRHFKRWLDDDWLDPLPMDPMSKSLKVPYVDLVEAQVFQIASCNLRCWYCFVPDNLKKGNQISASSFTGQEMIDLFACADNQVRLLDLSGGNPELVPEWLVDTMKALDKRGLKEHVYLWSDDTLTTDYFFQFLSKEERKIICEYPHYGKVGCFKGFDESSFHFNTNLGKAFYKQQFELFSRYLEMGLDIYGYVTFTSDNIEGIDGKINDFINRLKKIHPLLPLRIVPLKIVLFSPVEQRINVTYETAMINQLVVHKEWQKQLRAIYNEDQLCQRICDISLT
jgi:uncharacterized Fe-S cluster-containing radical SAM superfamily protein